MTNSEHAAPVEWILGLLDAIGSAPIGRATTRQCPAHHDPRPSLSVGAGERGQALVHCHAGCSWPAVLTALHLPARYLTQPPPVKPADYADGLPYPTFPPLDHQPRRPGDPGPGWHLDAIHDYGPDHRVLRYRRGHRKDLRWETRRGRAWIPGLLGVPTAELPLYREHDLRLALAAAEPVILVESESSVDALRGWYATTWAGGAATVPLDTLRRALHDHRPLLLIPDHDPPGRSCAERIHGVLPHARVLLGRPGEDARDLHDRLGPAGFRAAVEAANTTTEQTL